MQLSNRVLLATNGIMLVSCALMLALWLLRTDPQAVRSPGGESREASSVVGGDLAGAHSKIGEQARRFEEEQLSSHTISDWREVERYKSWDDFYRGVIALNVPYESRRGMIVRRIGGELSFNKAQFLALERILDEEEEQTTSAALREWGSPQGVRDAAAQNDNVKFWEKLKELRAAVRKGSTSELAKHFTPDQRTVVDRHLRNEVIRVSYGVKDKAVVCRVIGCGIEALPGK